MDEKYMKWLDDMCNEYFKEGKRLIKIKERYEKRGKDVPKNLNKRIRECGALYDYYHGLIEQKIESKLNMERERQEAELRKSLNAMGIGCDIMPFGFNHFYRMNPFIR